MILQQQGHQANSPASDRISSEDFARIEGSLSSLERFHYLTRMMCEVAAADGGSLARLLQERENLLVTITALRAGIGRIVDPLACKEEINGRFRIVVERIEKSGCELIAVLEAKKKQVSQSLYEVYQQKALTSYSQMR